MVAGARKKKTKKKAEPLVAPLSAAAFSLNPLSRAHPAKRLPPATDVIYSISWMSAYLRARSYETKVAWASRQGRARPFLRNTSFPVNRRWRGTVN